jgi:alkanesulfonate monooxygenase SsuD/methylene tetrahydromethanopterin reductase-like flavin-dependent oxidoreductase (luciferase family)
MGDPSDRDLKVGLILPTWTGSLDGRTPRWTDFVGLARLAEDVGFDSLWLPDMLRYRFGEGIDPLASWETWSLVAGLAASTRRLEIGTLVLVGAYRNPALLAEMAETVDEISGGRLVLGMGAGVNQDEHEAYGFSWQHRYDRLEEALTVIHALFRDGHVDFEGRYVTARDCELGLRGPRSAGPPILLGGTGPRIQRLAARFADLWNVGFFGEPSDVDTVARLRREVDDACAGVGREAGSLERTAAVMVHLGGPPAMLGPYDWSAGALRGSVAELASSLRAFAAMGISHLQVGLVPSTLASVESFARVLESLDRDARARMPQPAS